MRVVRTAVLASVALILVAGCGGDPVIHGPLGGPETAPASPRPLPKPTGEYRFEPAGGHKLRVEPISGPAEPGVPYRFEVPHCGLTWITDFDGSFWDPIDPKPGPQEPSVFINSDIGTITLTSPDTAVYLGSDGAEIELRRRRGPKLIFPCA